MGCLALSKISPDYRNQYRAKTPERVAGRTSQGVTKKSYGIYLDGPVVLCRD